MKAEIVEYFPVALDAKKSSNFPKLGTLKIKILDKMIMILDVIEGKNKSFFFKIPSTRVGDKWEEVYYFIGKPDFTKWVKEEIGDAFKAQYL